MSKTTPIKKEIIAGLDIGTTKVVFAIGLLQEDGVEIAGIGRAPNVGMKQGVVVNIDATAEAILKAKEEAELMAGITASSVWLGLGGAHVESFDSTGMVAIRNDEVDGEDIRRVIETAKAVAIPADREVLHVLPQDFKIDQQEGITDPVGMSGVRLESSVHIITGKHSAIQNSIKCTQKAGLQVNGVVLLQLASAMAVLSDDEKNLGAAVVDMGGGACDYVIYSQGSVVATGVVPVGGNNFTHDVAMGLRTTQHDAEELKRKYGSALAEAVPADESIDVEGVGGRPPRAVDRRDLCEILEARSEETLRLIKDQIRKSSFENRLGSGVVVTGGSSQLSGLVEMGDYIFDCPVRLGAPQRVGGLTDVVKGPEYSTCVGLLKYGGQEIANRAHMAEQESTLNYRWNEWTRKMKDLFGRSL